MAAAILLIDDEEENRLLAMTVLKTLGVEVLLAKNGAEGLALAGEKRPDLILLDIVMPGMTGLEVLQKLRADPKTRELHVVMLTSRQMPADLRQAQYLGARGFLNKPYDVDELLSRVCLELGLPMPSRG